MSAVFDHQNATGTRFTFTGHKNPEIAGLPLLQSISHGPLNKLRQGRSRLTGLDITGLLYKGKHDSHVFVDFSVADHAIVINTVVIINGDYAPDLREIHAAITVAFLQD